jgi:hypothetical protein
MNTMFRNHFPLRVGGFLCWFAFIVALALAIDGCSSTGDIARSDGTGNGTFVEGTPCAEKGFSCGLTLLQCDARTKTCLYGKSCVTDDDCPELYSCKNKECRVACIANWGCKKDAICDVASSTCVGAMSPAARDVRKCLPNCAVGHGCCAGNCSGSAVPMPGDCCSCLEGEVSTATCPGAKCGT